MRERTKYELSANVLFFSRTDQLRSCECVPVNNERALRSYLRRLVTNSGLGSLSISINGYY